MTALETLAANFVATYSTAPTTFLITRRDALIVLCAETDDDVLGRLFLTEGRVISRELARRAGE